MVIVWNIEKLSSGQTCIQGRTALSKIYFQENWRLSEDLDFTLLDTKVDLDSIVNALEREVPDIIQKENGMSVVLKDRPHTNIGYLQSRFQYTGPLGKDTVKIEISREEVIGESKIERVPHAFDYPEFGVRTYSLEDILAEKMRSMIQRKRIRDYYDTWRLLKIGKFDSKKVRNLFLEKCKSKKIQFNDVNQFFPVNLIQTLEPYLEKGLTRLSRESLPPLQTIINELNESLKTLLA